MGGYLTLSIIQKAAKKHAKCGTMRKVVLDELEQNHKLNLSGILGIFPAERV